MASDGSSDGTVVKGQWTAVWPEAPRVVDGDRMWKVPTQWLVNKSATMNILEHLVWPTVQAEGAARVVFHTACGDVVIYRENVSPESRYPVWVYRYIVPGGEKMTTVHDTVQLFEDLSEILSMCVQGKYRKQKVSKTWKSNTQQSVYERFLEARNAMLDNMESDFATLGALGEPFKRWVQSVR